MPVLSYMAAPVLSEWTAAARGAVAAGRDASAQDDGPFSRRSTLHSGALVCTCTCTTKQQAWVWLFKFKLSGILSGNISIKIHKYIISLLERYQSVRKYFVN